MKIKKLVASLSCAALITAAALPLAACGAAKGLKTDGSLNMTDYAAKYESSVSGVHDAFSTVKTIGSYKMLQAVNPVPVTQLGSSPFFQVKTMNSVGNYEYDVISSSGVKVVERAEDTDDFSPVTLGGIPVIRIKSESSSLLEGTTANYTFKGEDNTVLLSNASVATPTAALRSFYVEGETQKVSVLMLTVPKKDTVYFKVENVNGVRKFTQIYENDIHFAGPEYEMGEGAFSAQKPLFPSSADKPVSGELASFTYATVGSELVLYRMGNTEACRVSLDNVEQFAFVGNYMYYTKLVSLGEKDDSANLVYQGSVETRYSYELHKYDILNKKDTKFNYNVKIDKFEPIFNYKTNQYDAVVLYGAKIVNKTYQNNASFVYIADAELHVAYDLGDSSFAVDYDEYYDPQFMPFELYSIDGNHLMLHYDSKYGGEVSYVFNNDMERVSMQPGTKYFKDGVFKFTNENKVGFIDADGKIVVEPIYASTSIEFYGDYALAHNNPARKDEFLKLDGTTVEAPVATNYADYADCVEEDEKIVVYGGAGWYYELSNYVVDDGDEGTGAVKCTLTVYAYGGAKIGEVNNVGIRQSKYGLISANFISTGAGNAMIVPVVDSEMNISFSFITVA